MQRVVLGGSRYLWKGARLSWEYDLHVPTRQHRKGCNKPETSAIPKPIRITTYMHPQFPVVPHSGSNASPPIRSFYPPESFAKL